jgi:hypothetical protein
MDQATQIRREEYARLVRIAVFVPTYLAAGMLLIAGIKMLGGDAQWWGQHPYRFTSCQIRSQPHRTQQETTTDMRFFS